MGINHVRLGRLDRLLLLHQHLNVEIARWAAVFSPLPFTSRTSMPERPVFGVALRLDHDQGSRAEAPVNATRPLL